MSSVSHFKISAVIPTYNRVAHVLRAIESVLAQTASVDEVIVVDDGSTDETAEAIRHRFGAKVRLFCQENRGVSTARNRGVREARGEWIAFLDSDDIWLPEKIERQVAALAFVGEEFGLCFSDAAYHGHPERIFSVFQEAAFADERAFGAFDGPAEYLLGPPSPFRLQSIVVLRSLLEEVNGFDEALRAMEDLDVLFRLTFRTRFCFVSEKLVCIDRTPSRPHGLCEEFSKRGDRTYDDLRRVYTRWLTMPETSKSDYPPRIRELLRLVSYGCAECNIHKLRLRPTLRELGRLRELGDSYPAIMRTLLSRKIGKMRDRPTSVPTV